ncbi:hypothetical protein [Chryseobacterium gwangjuense]|uniref:hypothetical protein n=1 Tax=Chryseobacterium gwangjuense TaxID=1069980 RepID=UPI001E4BEA3C|nr:hypothetical protein [Chryseobacterium gwangjuense]MCE3075635.1 hypothetical protein [Chryseobacterium gwangjuense]
MKKNLFWRLLSLIILTFFLNSCRSEDLLQDDRGEQKYQVSILNKEEVNRLKPLLKELSEIKSKFRYNTNTNEKVVQNEILDGAIIGTNRVLLVENNGIKTYTFPISRTYLSSKSENLVVKENADHSFSGVLIQYDLTKEQQQKFISGEITDIKAKIKIYDIDKLNIAARVQTDQVGCYIITWETGWCSAAVHQTGSDSTCKVGGAPAPTILSIEDTCNQDSGGGNGTGDGGLGGIGTGGGPIDLGGVYITFPFVSLGYEYYQTEDPADPNYVHYVNTANYFISLGNTLNQLRVNNPDLFYYTYFYFKNNGINIPTKKFITERLTGLNVWYENVNSNPNLSPMNNQYFLNWAFQYLIQNPDITWQEFYDEYLSTPCDNIKSKFNDVKFKEKVTTIDKPAVLDYDHEMGYSAAYPVNTTIAETQYQPMENSLGTHNVVLPSGNQYFGFIHSHNNESNGGTPIKIFSPADVITFLTSCVRNAEENGNIKDAYCMVITSEGNYMLQYSGNGDFSIGPNQISNWKNWYLTEIQKLQNEDGTFDQADIEKFFANFLSQSVKITGLEVYKVEKITGNASRINTDGSKTPCP